MIEKEYRHDDSLLYEFNSLSDYELLAKPFVEAKKKNKKFLSILDIYSVHKVIYCAILWKSQKGVPGLHTALASRPFPEFPLPWIPPESVL